MFRTSVISTFFDAPATLQVLATIMASVGAPTAYATDIIAVQRVYYHQKFGFHCMFLLSPISSSMLTSTTSDAWLLVMSTQLIGFSIGGVTRRFLVAPPSMSQSCLP